MSGRHGRESDTQKLQRRNRELSILNAIAQALNQEVDLPRALNVALQSVAALFDLQTSWIFLLNDTGSYYLAAAHVLPPALADHPRRMMGHCNCLDLFDDHQLEAPINIPCSRLENLMMGTAGLRQHASIPLQAHGKPLGILNVANIDWGDLQEDDLRLLNLVGDLLAIAIERARLFQRSMEIGALEERNRLAREIHDTLAQGLTGIALQLETADALLENPTTAERARHNVAQALRMTRANLEEARRSVLDLRGAPLEGRSLEEALRDQLEEWASRRKVIAQFELLGDARPLPARLEIGLYRVLQEALTNIGRHAHAQQVRVQLTETPDHIRLIIHDDGRGFDPAQVSGGHFGLIGMNERARLMGGTLEISSAPGAGTRVDILVPLEGTR